MLIVNALFLCFCGILWNGASAWVMGPPATPPLSKFHSFATTLDSSICGKIASDLLQKGGSAVDAAIGAQICNGVENMPASGIGGGAFMLVYTKSTGKALAIDFRERAPLDASQLMFKNASSVVGGLSVAVLGQVAGYREAWKRFGRLPWRQLFQPSIDLCRKGFRISKRTETVIRVSEAKIRNSPGLRELLMDADGQFLKEGDHLVNPKLAETLQRVADDPKTFYKGKLGDDIVQEVRAAGGILRKEDLLQYKALVKPALRTKLRNSKLSVLNIPPPSSGAVVAFILRILDGYNFTSVANMTLDEYVQFHQRLIESFKFGYAKRGGLGDPNFEKLEVLKNLTSEAFANEVRKKITDDKTHSSDYYGPAYDANQDSGTSHLNVIAPNGDVVSMTSSINQFFGSGVRGNITGIIYNDSMDDFSTPGVPNGWGLAPSAKNFIIPGKRPLSSMSPTIVLDDKGNPSLSVGAAGGSLIISSVAYVAARTLFLGDTIKQAIDAPRIHHQFLPNVVFTEEGFPQEIIDELVTKGHVQSPLKSWSSVQGINIDRSGNIFANSDYRRGGTPSGL